VGQLSDFSQLDRGHITMTPRPVLVSETVERTLTDLGPVLADHNVYLHIPDGLAMLADEAAFHEVLTNIVDNAVKFSPADRRIIISVTRVAGEASPARACGARARRGAGGACRGAGGGRRRRRGARAGAPQRARGGRPRPGGGRGVAARRGFAADGVVGPSGRANVGPPVTL